MVENINHIYKFRRGRKLKYNIKEVKCELYTKIIYVLYQREKGILF